MDKVLVNLSLFLSFVLVLLGGSIWGQENEKEGWIKWMILFSVGVLMPMGNKLISKTAFHHQVLMALGFGLRLIQPEWALPMPQMWAIHGSQNAFGFGLCGLLSWRTLAARS